MKEEQLPENPSFLIEEFFKKYEEYSQNEKEKILLAWNFLVSHTQDKKSSDGSAYYLHPYRVACILAELHFDYECIEIAMLHNIYSIPEISKDEVTKIFGIKIAEMIECISKISKINISSKNKSQSDAIRNMFFALANDIRVIIIKIAERIDFMRNVRYRDESTQKISAQEILDIWAPLADRLGLKQGKNELEDLSLKYSNPDAYQQIKQIVSSKKNERSVYLEKAVQALYKAAAKAEIEVSISSRAKHFYSIYQKMRKRNKEAGELYDLLAIRILCDSNSDCYTLLGIVHQLWKPLEGRFKDYIAMPKANGYQSLHTTVMADGRPLEIQIRTNSMHRIAEHGVASHWLYKKGMSKDNVDVKSLPIYNQMLSLAQENLSDENLFSEFKNNLLKDKIVVFTPNGDVVQLPRGATAIDFAYAIHSAVGEKITAAKADGKIIQLSVPLLNTQIIEVITNPNAHPTENQLSYVVTYRAKQKIHAWISENLNDAPSQKIESKPEDESVKENRAHKRGRFNKEKQTVIHSGKIKIGKTTNFLMTIAGCCSPKYPDEIAGYVSRFRGITIHRKDCRIYQNIPDIENRSIEVEWEEE